MNIFNPRQPATCLAEVAHEGLYRQHGRIWYYNGQAAVETTEPLPHLTAQEQVTTAAQALRTHGTTYTVYLTDWYPVRLLVNNRDPGYWDRMDVHMGEGCAYCGRKVGKRDLWVFHLSGCDLVHPDDIPAVEATDDFIGWYRIGPSCAKKFPPEWVFTNAQYQRRMDR